MNKVGAGGGPAGGAFGVGLGGAGPTVAAAAAAAQRQRALLQRADADITSLLDNFSHLLKAARINEPIRNAQEEFQMEVHAARVVQAADSLLKLVSELKQTAVFSDFKSLNEQIEQRVKQFEKHNEESDCILGTISEQAAIALKELESHYYLSLHKNVDLDSAQITTG
ncbi:hypothetical protein GOP47_0024493 [Adiantum capillus-veneris]|uniref:Mediator complex subunit 22 n=1 Tax=Adiantum capillus-veneris TaxID=13818 RepID=A0A9D4U284_ADICA|nr:hypothetical protein GOP47_0024493 [Adiantum capillus-veneris]